MRTLQRQEDRWILAYGVVSVCAALLFPLLEAVVPWAGIPFFFLFGYCFVKIFFAFEVKDGRSWIALLAFLLSFGFWFLRLLWIALGNSVQVI